MKQAPARRPSAAMTSSPADRVAEVLAVLAPRLGRMIESTLQSNADVGISLRQFRMLDRLAEQPYRIGDLAAFASVTQPTVTASVKALLERRLVVRTTDASDRRAKLIAITEQGSETLEKAKCLVHARLLEIARDVDARTAAAVERLEPVLSAGMDRVRDATLAARQP